MTFATTERPGSGWGVSLFHQHRSQAVPPRCRWSKIRARRWPRPVSMPKARTPLRRLRASGEGAAHKQPCAREPLEAHQCVGAQRRRHAERAPPQWAGLVGLRPGLLPQVARKRAVLDAGGSSPVRHEGRFTDTPTGPAMELPRHASCKRPPATSVALAPLSPGVVLARVRAQAGEAVARGCRVGHVSIRERAASTSLL